MWMVGTVRDGGLVGNTGQVPQQLREQPVQQQLLPGARNGLLARRSGNPVGIPSWVTVLRLSGDDIRVPVFMLAVEDIWITVVQLSRD